MHQPHVIGVISYTHGLLRPEAIGAHQGSELIIHGGDVEKPENEQGEFGAWVRRADGRNRVLREKSQWV